MNLIFEEERRVEYKSLLKHLTLREQALLLTGSDFWHTNGLLEHGIPSIMMTDGPNGLRKEEQLGTFGKSTAQSVCYPSATALAASFDRNVMTEVGHTLADECMKKRVSVLLGPGINIKRSPLCGRNFEYYSEDPYLAGELAASYIVALQEKGVGACIKHFAANNTETRRMVSSSIVDERALHEIYLRGFEIAIKKAKPWSVMCAYNKINGTYCTENKYLLSDLLRDTWGYEGLTISDWIAVDDRINSLNAGLDLEMPSSGYANVRKIAKGYRQGNISAETIENSAARVLNVVEKSTELLKQPVTSVVNKAEHHEVARKVAENCVVLLKNEQNILPLSKDKHIAVIGERARRPLYQGCGSAQINSYRVDSALDALYAEGMNLDFAEGYSLEKPNEINAQLINEACAVAANSDVAVIFVSDSEINVTEGEDRKSLQLPLPQTELINAVCKVNPNTVVVLSTGSCVEMPWVNAPKAILQTYLLGEAFGMAVSNILVGKAVPSGKLPETYPVSILDTPCLKYYQTDASKNVLYKESIFVGYRYYEKTSTPVLFPFGHGLSYTSFNYSNLKLSSDSIAADDTVTLTFDISNTGSYAGAEAAQIYVAKNGSLVYRAKKELKEFTKVFLNVGETKTVSITLDRKAFEYYSATLGSFVVEDGEYEILIGSSSADIRLTAKINVKSTDDLSAEKDYMYAAPKYFSGDVSNVTDEDFEEIFGDYLDYYKPNKTDSRMITSDTLLDVADTKIGNKIITALDGMIGDFEALSPALKAMAFNTIVNIPVKRFTAITRGLVSDSMVDAFVHLINSNSVFEAVKVGATGIPDTMLNVLTPVVRAVAEKMSRK